MSQSRSVTSTERLKVGIKAALAGEYVDITTGTAEIAVMLEGERPTDSDYVNAEWEMIQSLPYATVLLGPEGAIELTLTDEPYVPWVRITIQDQIIEVKGGPDHVIEVY